MISKKMETELNGQMNKEMYSGYLYLAMSAKCASLGLPGFANWFRIQYQEEMEHAQRFWNYMEDQGATVKLLAIDEPPSNFKTPLAMFEKTLAHEKLVTKSIDNLVALAGKEKDKATEILLQWFVTEQIEEEKNPSDIIAKLKLVGNQGNGLFMIDAELANRVFVSELAAEKGA